MTHQLALILLRRTAACCLALFVPLQAGAFSIVIEPACIVDPSDGQVVPAGAGPVNWDGVGSSTVGEGIVTWDYSTNRANWAAIVQICRTNRALVVDFSGADGGQEEDVFYDMVFGEDEYTLRDIANTLRGLGVEARTARNYYGSCVCDAAGY